MTPSGADHAAMVMLGNLADAAVRAAIVGGIVGLVLVVFRVKRAAIRLCVWTAVLAAAIVMPAVSRLLPPMRWTVPIAWSPARMSSTRAPRVEPPRARPAASGPLHDVGERNISPIPLDTSARVSISAGTSPPQAGFMTVASWPVVAMAIYLVGLAGLLLRITIGWLVAARLERRATLVADADAHARLGTHTVNAHLTQPPRLVETPDLFIPITLGVVRPVIMLPDTWREWSAEKLTCVLAHEIAHVARRDVLTYRCSLLYRAVCWFSPFSWWLHRHLIHLGDEASDDVVLDAGVDQTAYAEVLLEFFAVLREVPRRAAWHVAMASGASAERRVERVLAWNRARAMTLTRRAALFIALAAAPIVVLAASPRPMLMLVEPLTPPAPPSYLLVEPAPPVTIPAWPEAIAAAMRPPVRSIRQLDIESTPVSPLSQGVPTPQSETSFPDLPRDLTGYRLIEMIFDLRMSPGDSLPREINWALQYVDREMSATDYISVSTFGSTLQTLQDFTADKDKLRAALATVKTSGDSASNTVRLAAVTATCDSLSRRQQDSLARFGAGLLDVKNLLEAAAVFYFSSGVTRGMEAPVEMRAVEQTCFDVNVPLYWIDDAVVHPRFYYFNYPSPYYGGDAREFHALLTVRPDIPMEDLRAIESMLIVPVPRLAPVGTSLGVVPHQLHSPVTLIQTTSALDNGFASVTVRNDSTKPIRAVTLAALVRPADKTVMSPQIFMSQAPVTATIAPNERLEISSRLLDDATVAILGKQGAAAQLGVVAVEFADGSMWTYDLKAKGHFEIGDRQ